MKFEMQKLPYDYAALEPHISEQTLRFHYDKHHAGYMKKLKAAIGDTPEAEHSLERLVKESSGSTFNLAAQVWNHDFYWRSLSPDGGGEPQGELATAVNDAFGSFDSLRSSLKEAAAGHFGSGWAWLVAGTDGRLQVTSTHDADNPIRYEQTPLLTIDVWEHAYYLDVKNDRGKYLDRVLDNLLNWKFAAENYTDATDGKPIQLRAV